MLKRCICNLIPLLACWLQVEAVAVAQRKPERATAPVFKPGQFEGIFYDDVTTILKGSLPGKQAASLNTGSNGATATADASSAPAGDSEGLEKSGGVAWKELISPTSLEDLIKGSKLRLDRIVTTPAVFAGGGFQEARKEFSLQALLFAIIETHPGDVRWKNSAGVARESLVRVAANTKIGSRQVYDEAKKRLVDLGDLLNGSQLPGEAKAEIDWSALIDRVPLMQLLDWAQTDFVSTYSASEARFAENKEELGRYAELMAVLGQVSLQENMPDASDDEYRALAMEMIAHAKQINLAVQTNNAELARQASGKLGQSCTNCHDNFR